MDAQGRHTGGYHKQDRPGQSLESGISAAGTTRTMMQESRLDRNDIVELW